MTEQHPWRDDERQQDDEPPDDYATEHAAHGLRSAAEVLRPAAELPYSPDGQADDA